MDPAKKRAHPSDGPDSRELGGKFKKALRMAKPENTVVEADRIVSRIHRKQATTHYVRDLMDLGSSEGRLTEQVTRVSEAVARVSLSRFKSPDPETVPGLPVEAIERYAPLLALTFVMGAFVIAVVLLGRPGSVPADA